MENLENPLEAEAIKTQIQNQGLEKSKNQGMFSDPGQIFAEAKKLSLFKNEDGLQKLVLITTSFLFGPFLTYLMLINPQWPFAVKMQLSLVVYLSSLFIFFSFYDRLVSALMTSLLGKSLRPNFFAEFLKFSLTFLTTTKYQQTFIYEPVLQFKRVSNLSMLIISTCIYSAVAAAIFYRFRQMKDMALKSKAAQAEAQYNLLESQMQPHFLFNSLNVLSELIYVDPDLANSMTQQMADLYREILNNSKSKFSTLESEISILRKYVEIQKIRFGNRIRFEVNVSPAFYNLQIPSLMLQTLVENAIKHGISPKQEGGEILLSVKKISNLFEVCISNTGALYKGHKESKRSTGLQNTRNRLELTYGNKNAFKIYSDDKRTYVKFMITGRTS